MKYFKLSILFIATAFFITACSQYDSDDVVYTDPNGYEREQSDAEYVEGQAWARENLDLQAVGSLLEKAENAEELEYLLNDPRNGVNNLDLNGDGYVDYISVREFDDRYDDERGFSLFSMFGPDAIQEIATIIFNRNGYNYPGARVLLTGNEQIYGDNYYYETNWLERSIPIVRWIFNDRDNYYRSPYYYGYYPEYYEVYEVVETPVYVTRIREFYPEPIFIQTYQPTITKIKIKSPYKDKSWNKIYAKLAKPTKDQFEFKKNNPKPPEFVRVKNEKRNNVAVRDDKFEKDSRKFEKENRKQFEKREKFENERPEMREKPNKPERIKPQKPENPKFEKQKPQKQENRVKPNGNGKQNGGGNNKGSGNNKGGNGKGKGKP